jgi:N-acetylglucosamine-6-phosphate deacetylase
MTAVVEGRDPASSLLVRLRIDGGFITSIDELGQADDGPWLAPGLVDLQVNGCAGFDFNVEELDGEAVQSASLYLASRGVTSFLPTLVTGSEERITSSLRTIAQVADACEGARIAGIHLEGPFISRRRGPRGAHDARFVRPPDWDLLERWQEAADGAIRIVTLAPEWPGALEFIERCTRAGVIVAIGHTAATNRQISDAVVAGAQLSTHLGNGCDPTIPRHTGYFWAQLGCDALYASIIADGIHLSRDVLKAILRTKRERVFVVSDSIATTFDGPGEYESSVGGTVVVTAEGRVRLANDAELLAGSIRQLDEAIAYLVRSGLAGLDAAWHLCSTRPAQLLDLPQGAGLAVGAPADLVVFDWDADVVTPLAVYRAGHLVAGSSERYG